MKVELLFFFFNYKHLTESLPEEGPFPIHMEVERRAPPEGFFKKKYSIFSIFDLESLSTLAPVEYLGLLAP